MIDVLIVPPFERLELVSLAKRSAPREACALALATSQPGRAGGTVFGVVPLENVAAEPEESFDIGQQGLALAAVLREQRLGVVLFHSHARGPAHLSSGDLRFGRPGERHLIYSLGIMNSASMSASPAAGFRQRCSSGCWRNVKMNSTAYGRWWCSPPGKASSRSLT